MLLSLPAKLRRRSSARGSLVYFFAIVGQDIHCQDEASLRRVQAGTIVASI